MKCPFNNFSECLKEDCACFDPAGRCSIAALYSGVYSVADGLDVLCDTMSDLLNEVKTIVVKR